MTKAKKTKETKTDTGKNTATAAADQQIDVNIGFLNKRKKSNARH